MHICAGSSILTRMQLERNQGKMKENMRRSNEHHVLNKVTRGKKGKKPFDMQRANSTRKTQSTENALIQCAVLDILPECR